MIEENATGIATTAKLGGHPLHPMLIPFPIAFLAGTLVSDLAFLVSGNEFWAQASFWLLAAAMVMSVAAAAAGLTDFMGNARIRRLTDARHHMVGNIVAVTLALANFVLRWSAGEAQGVLPWGLVLSILVVGLLLYSGRKGGSLVYVHRVGVHPEGPRE